ncbi:MAG TPA: hypothetical protein VHD83_13750 [Puia sp.]|nr:hypothetical protein [Puia sp.]
MATTHDFSTFKLRVNVKTSVENAFQAWATPGGMQSWFLGKIIYTDAQGRARENNEMAQAGDHYAMYLLSNPADPVVKGKILKTNDKNLFSFSFANDIPVTITFYTEHGETIIELIESNLPTEGVALGKQFASDSKGWVFFLTNLKSVLEGGIDLRNTNVEIKNVITG